MNRSAATASFAVLTLGVGWQNGFGTMTRPEWRTVQSSDEVRIARLVLASGSSANWSPITPEFTLITEQIILRTVRLEQDALASRALGLLRLDHDGGSRLYGVYVNMNVEVAKRIFLVPFDGTVAQNGFLTDVLSQPLFNLGHV